MISWSYIDCAIRIRRNKKEVSSNFVRICACWNDHAKTKSVLSSDILMKFQNPWSGVNSPTMNTRAKRNALVLSPFSADVKFNFKFEKIIVSKYGKNVMQYAPM